jgi:galactonate dehydratase
MRSGQYAWSTVFPTLYAADFETALIKVMLDDGTTGWGEAQAPLAPEVACTIAHLLLAPVLVGAEFAGEVSEIEALWDKMYATMRVRGQTGGFMLDAISGIDIALWDLAGKMQGLPVSALISKCRLGAMPAYLSGVAGKTVEERVEHAVVWQAEGFTTFKLFYDCGRDEFLGAVKAMRSRLGSNAKIAADALWRLTPENAVAFGQELDEANACWLEAPLMPENAKAHGSLARAIRTPVAIGESYRTRYELAAFFDAGAMTVVQPDLGRCGITESIRIAETAARRGLQVIPHLSIAMGPQIAAAIHFASATANCPLLEYNPHVLEIANEYLREPIQMNSAEYSVPPGPGLGIQMYALPIPEI